MEVIVFWHGGVSSLVQLLKDRSVSVLKLLFDTVRRGEASLFLEYLYTGI